MNPKLKEINELIDLCDQMLDYAKENGCITSKNEIYQKYKFSWEKFAKENNISDIRIARHFLGYGIKFLTAISVLFSLNMIALPIFMSINTKTEILYQKDILEIRNALIELKHTKFKDDFEKIFISHREKDAKVVSDFIELLYAIGIKRPNEDNPSGCIFCTSHPDGYIPNGEPNSEIIRNMLSTDEHVFYILWYSDEYFDSPACLNEAGAIWAMKKKYQEILMPSFDSNKIRGLLDKQPVWFRVNDKMRLNTFKEQVEKMFDLTPITINTWELARDRFVEQVSKTISEKEKSYEL